MALNIEIIDVNHPIFQSELINWLVDLAKINSRKKGELERIYQQILSLVDNPDDYISENLRIFIDGKPFSCDVIRDYDFKTLMQELKNHPKITVGKESTLPNKEEPKQVENIPNNSNLLNLLKKLSLSTSPTFFYHTVPISPSELLHSQKDGGLTYFIINEVFLPYLRFLDLSQIDFANTDLRGIDLSYTNISKIDFNSIYKNSLENTNLEGVNLAGHELKNICADGANLNGTYLFIDLDSVSLEQSIFDGTVKLWKDSQTIVNTRARKPVDVILHF